MEELIEEFNPAEVDTEKYEDFESIYNTYSNIHDPIQMYLADIGNLKMLTADDEYFYGKQIEAARDADIDMSLFAGDPDNAEAINTYMDIKEDSLYLSESDKEYLISKYPKLKDYIIWDGLVEQGVIARETMINGNLKLVVSIAKKYTKTGFPFLDLIQEGNLGLIKAVERFEPDKGYKFSTYATWWIRQAITRAISDQHKLIRIPVHMIESQHRIFKMMNQYQQETGEKMPLKLVAEKSGLSIDKVEQIISYDYATASLDDTVGEENETTLGEMIRSDDKTPEDYCIIDGLKQEVQKALADLSEKEANILKYRYGMVDGRIWTLEAVGDLYGVTRERIRQIEATAIRKLKHPSRSKSLRTYWEAL